VPAGGTTGQVLVKNSAVNYDTVWQPAVGLWKPAAIAATIAPLPANVSAVAPATLTASANGALPPIDGVTLSVGSRILVKNETISTNDGVYQVTSLGGASAL
jgi:hypothetical protein